MGEVSTSGTVRVRFAPSPTGSPHIGNIRTALFTWLFARKHGGVFILRIEDTDRARYVEGSVQEIMDSLRWLGLDWDEGPYFQSQRLPLYREVAEQLVATGHAYRCYCTPERLEELRRQQEAAKQPTGYDRKCRYLSEEERAKIEAAGTPYVIRFAMPLEGETVFHDEIRGEIRFENALLDDFVMLKSDGYPTYHLASVTDDHHMGITHVIRGEEWISSTPRHVQLYRALGWEIPKFAHLPMILGTDRKKLSKRHGSVQFVEYIQQGYLPEAMFNFLALLGWSADEDRELYSREELIERFDLSGVQENPAIFDGQKLLWMNGMYIRRKPIEELTQLCLPYLQEARLIPQNPSPEQVTYAQRVIALEAERMKLLSEVVPLTEYFFRDVLEYEEKGVRKWFTQPYVPQMLERLIERYSALEPFDLQRIEETTRAVAEELGVSAAQVIHPTRLAVSGRTVGPGLFEMIEVMGKQRVLQRLRAAREMLPLQGQLQQE
ncbi:MAG: glutamate--tRNA ligase [Armatimonadetes bacterium]|nr:glutamate--tRNA ligase [Armatimonadota bacterium]